MAQSEHPALERILRRPGMRKTFRLLTEELSGSDLTSLLLEVFRRRAEKLSPVDVLRRSRRDRFARGSAVPFERLRAVEDACIAALPEDFRWTTLSPLEPLGTHSVIARVDQNNVVSTIRSTEVASDPTNGLALAAARERASLMARGTRSPERVRSAAFQRVFRAQRFEEDGMSFSHFELLSMVTAGRDAGGVTFEREAAGEHLRFMAASCFASARRASGSS